MGMFDYLRCKYPLPREGANDLVYQTKDLDCAMDDYEIREDGTLWQEDYDIEDHSDPTKEGWKGLVGCMTRVNPRWVQVPGFTREIRFYDYQDTRWIEWSAYFVKGALKELHLLRDGPV